jgi:hypothetical protein
MLNRRIKLSWQTSRYYASDTDGIRVRIEASAANLMPDKIFAYLLLPVKPGADNRAGMFDHVCSPSDLEEYPEDAPVAGSRPAWFRLNYVDVLLRSREEVEDFVAAVQQDVTALKIALDRVETLEPGTEIWIGSPPAAPIEDEENNL